MVKRAAALIGLVVYVAASAWLVRSEGESYRRSLLLDREARAAKETTAPPVAIVPTPWPEPPSAVVAMAPDPSPSPPISAPAPAVQPTQPPQAPKADSSWDGPEFKQTWDLAKLSPEEEDHFGQTLHDLIVRLNPTVEGGPWPRRCDAVAEPLLAAMTRKGITLKYTVLDSPEINAFSHPGGYIYLSKGLLDQIGDEEDYILQFVLAHELAHIDMRHAQLCLTDKGIKFLGYGTLKQFYTLIVPLAYPDELEFAADRWAFDQLRRLDRTRLETLTFLLRYEDYARSHKFENGRDHRPLVEGETLIERHYRSHPAPYKRLKALKAPAPAPAPRANPPR